MKSINWGLCCIINVSLALSGTNVAMYIQWRENYVYPFVKHTYYVDYHYSS